MSIELQHSAGLRHRGDNVVGSAIGEFRVDFEGDDDVRFQEAGEVL
jgi:hypothetical protein